MDDTGSGGRPLDGRASEERTADERASGKRTFEEQTFEERIGDFYSPAVSLIRLRPRPDVTGAPADLLLRALEPPAVKVRHIPLVDLLRKPYRELGGD
ncbi:hypothetical protein [Streptosporangium sp. LJ11]|uniref:hypothetical protein n=1 Tax=Streptosporangium sp. LJ11 TaxID=3436927 RepID=UPI003F79C46D